MDLLEDSGQHRCCARGIGVCSSNIHPLGEALCLFSISYTVFFKSDFPSTLEFCIMSNQFSNCSYVSTEFLRINTSLVQFTRTSVRYVPKRREYRSNSLLFCTNVVQNKRLIEFRLIFFYSCEVYTLKSNKGPDHLVKLNGFSLSGRI